MALPDPSTTTPTKPTIVGIYGVPGCGKSFLLHQLKTDLGEDHFASYDGSAVLSSLIHGGLDAFKKLDDQEKNIFRERAISKIAQDCSSSGRIGIVAGHYLFWDVDVDSGAGKPQVIWTDGDADVYTHILYFEVPADVVVQRRRHDTMRKRPSLSQEHITRWQRTEIDQLREICSKQGIHFSIIPPTSNVLEFTTFFLREQSNFLRAKNQLDTSLRDLSGQRSKTILVLDGDKTLTSDDTGAIFVKLMLDDGLVAEDPLKAVFSSLNYTYTAFWQVARRVYDCDALPEQTFEAYCQQVTASVSIHPEILCMLRQAKERGVTAIVLTCGLQRIWEKILEGAGLSPSTVKVIGNGRSEDVIVTGEVKGVLVSRLRDVHQMYVCAFGDSILDLPMLKGADKAIVVVGDKRKRSVGIDQPLLHAIDNEHLNACQVLLPPTSPPRLDIVKLPLTDITSPHFITSIVSPAELADKNAAKLLMTPMRDATVYGPALRKAHSEVGRHLAVNLLSKYIGLEEYAIQHVQGTQTVGYRFQDEAKMLIVALMRGGEPMALGVSEAMPLAIL
ncbi:hypothetical protein D9758_019067 [Tetrapyrgos nigripes]|uniref:Phosphoribosyltransferase domain-containing protein n=1 Tax=Tetrapyrgos nigripes TaxID=182062 RepID=A0A8H5AQP7_9AGAR|nr:hypothetical protein D9758_019067 [Tetrapyrgos nigripes]